MKRAAWAPVLLIAACGGVEPDLRFEPAVLEFGCGFLGCVETVQVRVHNRGSQDVRFFEARGDDAALGILSLAAQVRVPAGRTRTLVLHHRAGPEVDEDRGWLSLGLDVETGTTTRALAYRHRPEPGAGLRATPWPVRQVGPGTSTLTLSVLGSRKVAFSRVRWVGSSALTMGPLAPLERLEPGTPRQLNVTFVDERPGFHTGSIRFEAGTDDSRMWEWPVRATTIRGAQLHGFSETQTVPDCSPASPVQVEWRLDNHGGEPAQAQLGVRTTGGVVAEVPPRVRVDGLSTVHVPVRVRCSEPGRFSVEAEARWAPDAAVEQVWVGETKIPRLVVSPPKLDFGARLRDSRSSALIELRNPGGGKLLISSVSLSPGSEPIFTLVPSAHTEPTVLEAQPRTWTVEFAPPGPGIFERELRIGHDEGLTVVPVRGRGLACEEACDVANATPTCFAGSCEIDACAPGYFDVDARVANGCECGDLDDVAADCRSTDWGTIYERDPPRQLRGRVPAESDEDVVRFFAHDGFHVFREHHDVHIELETPDPSIRLCVYRRPTEKRTNDCLLIDETCPASGGYRYAGRYGVEDAAEYIVRIFRAKGAAPSCLGYELRIRNGQ